MKKALFKFFGKTADVAEDAIELTTGGDDRYSQGRGGHGQKHGFLGGMLGGGFGGLGDLLKSGGTIGLLLLLVKMIVDIAKSNCSDEEWDSIVRPVKNSFDNLLGNFGMETPNFIVANVGLLEERDVAKNLTLADQERIATELNSGFPEGAERELTETLQFHQIQLQEQLDEVQQRSIPVTDKFGSVELSTTSELSLDGLDELISVNQAGVVASNVPTAAVPAKSRSL